MGHFRPSPDSFTVMNDEEKAFVNYKKAAEYHQAEGAYKLSLYTFNKERCKYWWEIAQKQGYKKGMKSWTSDIEEFNQ